MAGNVCMVVRWFNLVCCLGNEGVIIELWRLVEKLLVNLLNVAFRLFRFWVFVFIFFDSVFRDFLLVLMLVFNGINFCCVVVCCLWVCFSNVFCFCLVCKNICFFCCVVLCLVFCCCFMIESNLDRFCVDVILFWVVCSGMDWKVIIKDNNVMNLICFIIYWFVFGWIKGSCSNFGVIWLVVILRFCLILLMCVFGRVI